MHGKKEKTQPAGITKAEDEGKKNAIILKWDKTWKRDQAYPTLI